MSLEDLAREVRHAARRRGLRSGTTRQQVWRWEAGRQVPDADSQLLLADAFGIEQAAVAAVGWPMWLPGYDTALPFGPRSTVPAVREALMTSLDRRSFLSYGAAVLTGLAEQWALVEPGCLVAALDGKRVDADLVDWLETTSAKLTTLVTEQRQHTVALLDAHLSTVVNLLEEGRYSGPVGHRLHVLAASLAQTAGWYRFDLGQHAAAGRYWHAALHSAHASGDRDLGAGVLSDLAYQSTWLRDPRTAVDILQHAIPRTHHPAARSLLHLRLARAHAALRNATACRRSLAAAETELATSSPDPTPAWCSWMSPADLAVDSGRCLSELGQDRRAHHLIGEGMALLPRAATRPGRCSSPTKPKASCGPASPNRRRQPPLSPWASPAASALRAVSPWSANSPPPSLRTPARRKSPTSWTFSASQAEILVHHRRTVRTRLWVYGVRNPGTMAARPSFV